MLLHEPRPILRTWAAVAVAQHLHAMIASFSDNNVTSGIECNTGGMSKSPGACSFTTDGAKIRGVTVAQNLNMMVAASGIRFWHEYVFFIIS